VPANLHSVEMLEKLYIAHLRYGLHSYSVLLYLKSSFHMADITKIKMNWLEYLSTVISCHRTVS